MDLRGSRLETAKEGLKYAVLFAKTEQETADFALLLLELEAAIIREHRK